MSRCGEFGETAHKNFKTNKNSYAVVQNVKQINVEKTSMLRSNLKQRKIFFWDAQS